MKVVIYGNGAMARVLFSYAKRKHSVAGFSVDEACIAEGQESFCGLPLVPFENVQNVFPPLLHKMITGVGFVEMNDLRMRKYKEGKEKGYEFLSYIHDSVMPHDNVEVEENCVILDHVSIHPGCRIGAGTFISSNVNIGHDCEIGAGVWINSGVAIAGGCRVGSGCFFGVNSCTSDGITLGARTFVAANTLIAKDTGSDEVYVSSRGEKFRLRSKSFLEFGRNAHMLRAPDRRSAKDV